MKGEATIYRKERGKKVNRPPRFTRPLRRVTSPRSEDHAHAISSHALEGHAGCWFAWSMGARTIVRKEGYRSKNAPTAHLGPGVRRLARRWVHSRSRAPLERGVERDGPTSSQYLGAQAPWASWPIFESWLVPSPWFFLKERQRALGTDRMDPITIWIGRSESGVSH